LLAIRDVVATTRNNFDGRTIVIVPIGVAIVIGTGEGTAETDRGTSNEAGIEAAAAPTAAMPAPAAASPMSAAATPSPMSAPATTAWTHAHVTATAAAMAHVGVTAM
jgi:hypothetical protein